MYWGGVEMTQVNSSNLEPTSKSSLRKFGLWLIDNWGKIILAGITIPVAKFVWAQGWIVVAAFAISVFIFLIAVNLAYDRWQAAPLRRWEKLTETTDLIGFAEKNSQSEYMPAKIFERAVVRDLAVMGNGCGKWARSISNAVAREKFRAIQAARGRVRFLASCPIYLSGTGESEKIEKAKKNAKSLLILKEFRDSIVAAGGNFEIKTYKHLATLRLIILDKNECIVGHYQEDGVGESLDTPLLVFKGDEANEWGFKHAFVRLFDSEWHRAVEPTDDEWEAISNISNGGSIT